MTVTSEVSRSGPYNGNGSTTVFPYEFKIFTAADLLVTEVDLDGIETTLVEGTDYTVDGVLSDDGGDVTLTTALAGDGTDAGSHKLTIRRVLDATQTMNLRSQGKISAEVLERAHDRAIMLIQQLLDERNRSLRLIESEAGSELLTLLPTLADRKGRTLGFDDTTGQPATFSTASTAISAAMEAVVQAATLALARAAMGPWGDAQATATGSTTARALADIFATVVNVNNFGAVGDGVNDDTSAIQAAINHAATKTWGVGGETTGAVVFFPGGRYKISSSLTIGANTGVSLLGEGKTKSNLIPTSTSLTVIQMSGSNNSRSFIRGMRISGGSAAAGIAINIVSSGNQIDVRDCWIDTIKQGIVGNPTSDSYFTDNTMEYVSECFVFTSSNDLTIAHNTLVDCGPIALGGGSFAPLIALTTCTRIGIMDNRIISVSAMSSQPNGIVKIASSSLILYKGNIGNDAMSYVGGAYIDSSSNDRLTIEGNHFGPSYGATIKDVDSANLVIQGNTFKGSSQAGVKTIDLSGTVGYNVIGNIFKGGSGQYDLQCINGTALISGGVVQGNTFSLGYNITTIGGSLNLFNNIGGATRNWLTAAPTTGAWLRGDVVYHQQPSASGIIGWVCVTAGTPGTWKSWGTIAA